MCNTSNVLYVLVLYSENKGVFSKCLKLSVLSAGWCSSSLSEFHGHSGQQQRMSERPTTKGWLPIKYDMLQTYGDQTLSEQSFLLWWCKVMHWCSDNWGSSKVLEQKIKNTITKTLIVMDRTKMNSHLISGYIRAYICKRKMVDFNILSLRS